MGAGAVRESEEPFDGSRDLRGRAHARQGHCNTASDRSEKPQRATEDAQRCLARCGASSRRASGWVSGARPRYASSVLVSARRLLYLSKPMIEASYVNTPGGTCKSDLRGLTKCVAGGLRRVAGS
jgi:hypothetical protein